MIEELHGMLLTKYVLNYNSLLISKALLPLFLSGKPYLTVGWF